MKAGSPVLVETSLGTVALAYASAARNKWSQCKPFRKWQWHCIKALHESVMVAVPLHETIPLCEAAASTVFPCFWEILESWANSDTL